MSRYERISWYKTFGIQTYKTAVWFNLYESLKSKQLILTRFFYLYTVKTSKLSPQNSFYQQKPMTLFVLYPLQQTGTRWDARSASSKLAILSEYSLHAWCNAAGFAVRHCLPDYLPLCGATFLRRYLVYMIILPMLHEDLKHLFFSTGRNEY